MEPSYRKRSLCYILTCSAFIFSYAAAHHERNARYYGAFQLDKESKVDWSSDFDTELYLDEEISKEELPHMFPSNGDMRLVSSTDYLDTPTAGRLELYIQSMYCIGSHDHQFHDSVGENGGSWGTVCGDGFTMNEAHVACRQLGYQEALKWDYSVNTEFGMANESTPIVLADVTCPKSTLLHLLRCNHNELVNGRVQYGCDHTKDVVVYCDTVRIWDEPYSGQVRLISDDRTAHSYGRVEVFQGHQWGTVCKENFNEAAANSICRQLGYTGAVAVSDAQPGTGLVWVNKVSCESSQPCFTLCFTHHTWTHDCNHTQDIAIQCAFDVNRASVMTSGSRAQCQIKLFPLTILIVCTTLALLAVLVVGCGVVSFVVITRCCRKKCVPKNRCYEQLS